MTCPRCDTKIKSRVDLICSCCAEGPLCPACIEHCEGCDEQIICAGCADQYRILGGPVVCPRCAPAEVDRGRAVIVWPKEELAVPA